MLARDGCPFCDLTYGFPFGVGGDFVGLKQEIPGCLVARKDTRTSRHCLAQGNPASVVVDNVRHYPGQGERYDRGLSIARFRPSWGMDHQLEPQADGLG